MLQLVRNSICASDPEINALAMKWKQKWLNKIPDSFFRNQASRDGDSFHVTIVNKCILKSLPESEAGTILSELEAKVKSLQFLDIGVGKVTDNEGSTAYFVVLLNSELSEAVKQVCSVDIECFHLTLGFSPFDVHNVPKNLSTLLFAADSLRPVNERVPVEVKTLAKRGQYEEALKVASLFDFTANPALLDLVSLIFFKLGRYDESIETAMKMMKLDDDDCRFKSNLRVAESCLKTGHHLDAVFAIAKCVALSVNQNQSAQEYLKLLISKCMLLGIYRIDLLPVSRKLLKEDEVASHINDEMAAKALEFYKTMTSVEKSLYQQLIAEASRQYGPVESDKLCCPVPLECRYVASDLYVLPRNFSWLWPEKLAVMSTPRKAKDIDQLAKAGINLVITLTEEEPLQAAWFKAHQPACRNIFLPTPNYQPTSTATADEIVWQVARALSLGEKVLIHCGGGKGRAGTAAALVMIALGMNPNSVLLCLKCSASFTPFGLCTEEACCMSSIPQMDPAWTLSTLRAMRPESLETDQQVDFLKTYSATLWNRISKRGQEERVEEREDDLLEIIGTLPSQTPSVIITVGLPGSGKSTFCTKLTQSLPSSVEVIRVSQDEIGGRRDFESALSAAGKNLMRAGKKTLVLVDKCSPTVEDRKSILDILGSPVASKVVCLFFDISAELCEARINRRFDHPTIPAGKGRNPIEHFSKLMQEPSTSEGFGAVFKIKTIADANKAVGLLSLGSSVPATDRLENFFKFPRTPHLFDLGAATRDDLILTGNDLVTFFAPAAGKSITMEEKIDGANMGFSMNEEGKILAQNRSHYVDSKYHPQFQKLGSYIFQKQADLKWILCEGRRILYGEWLYARHSIHYTKIPDYFIAFDIFDVEEKRFLDRETFYALLNQTSIAYIEPLVENCELYNTREALTNLIKTTRSKFSDQLIEGVYFRWDQDGRLKTRAKLVRQDFIAGNDHWSKGMIQPNFISRDT